MTPPRDLAWPVYYVGQLGTSDDVPSAVFLEGPEARHAAVRRHRPGEWVVLTAGQGRWVAGPVTHTQGKSGLAIAVEMSGAESLPTPIVTVVQALPKSDRADEAVELLTAVGVDRIVPWQAERSIARWSPDRIERGLARWRRTAAEAAKQSRRVRWPVICSPVDGLELAELVAAAPMVLTCHEQAEVPIVSVPVAPDIEEVVVVIGPEGGISDAELDTLTDNGAVTVSLGSTVLRTSVAGGIASALVMSRVGRLLPAEPARVAEVDPWGARVDALDGLGAP